MAGVLLIISGSIAAYKSLELIRRLKERGIAVRCILTPGGAQFITPLSVASLSGEPVYGDLFSLKDEVEMGHIRLTREADVVVVAPASADLIAKMATGRADDLATAALLASDKSILVAPAMNARMWEHPATQRNLKQIEKDGAILIPPASGELACGEIGEGRMAEPEAILQAIVKHLSEGMRPGGRISPEHRPMEFSGENSGGNQKSGNLKGKTALVTSGPTHEALDPVRYLANRSSGKQGHAIAVALARHGARVTLISGPTALPDPAGVQVVQVQTAEEMLAACESALPVDIAVCAAAVADWRPAKTAGNKIKKSGAPPRIVLAENPDILKTLAQRRNRRPKLVIGFAAETTGVLTNAKAKRMAKGCDWILANDVSKVVFGAEENTVTLIDAGGAEPWPRMRKDEVAEKLAARVAAYLKRKAA